jgi:hypothetical protein
VSIQSVLLPLFVQVLLTFALLFRTGGVRSAAVRRGDVHPRDVALRLVHAYIHITSNCLKLRFSAFAAGALVLAVLWAIFVLRIMFELG